MNWKIDGRNSLRMHPRRTGIQRSPNVNSDSETPGCGWEERSFGENRKRGEVISKQTLGRKGNFPFQTERKHKSSDRSHL